MGEQNNTKRAAQINGNFSLPQAGKHNDYANDLSF